MIRWNQAPMIREQAVLFSPTLDAAISSDHSVRLVDEVLGQMDWSAWESRYVLVAGQPPIAPRVMAGAILYGLTLGIRSSRKLEDACTNRLDFLWLVEGRQIDHSTFAKFRTRFDKELKKVFRDIILLARGMGVACLNQICSDGTRVRANNARYNTARQNKIEELEQQIDQQITELLKTAEQEDQRDRQLFGPQPTGSGKLPADLHTLEQRKAKLQYAKAELQAMQDKRGSRSDVSAKGPQIPLADPDARVLPNKQGGYAPNYTPMASTETKGGLIVDADVVVGNNEEATLIPSMDRIEEQYGEKPEKVLADSGFNSGPNLAGLEERRIAALIPARQEFENNPAVREDPTVAVEESQRAALPINAQSKVLDKAAFIYQPSADRYYCPMGKALSFYETTTYQRDSGRGIYRVYQCGQCHQCPLASQCLRKNQTQRRVYRDEYDAVRERATARIQTPAGKETYSQRMAVAESPFGIIKNVMNVRQFLLRGINKVRMEWRWITAAFNLKKLISVMAALRQESAVEGGVAPA